MSSQLDLPPPSLLPVITERILARTYRQPGNDCLLWRGAADSSGFGQIRVGDRVRQAHRVAYAIVRGPIPVDSVLVLTCRRPGCVNVEHMRPEKILEQKRRVAAEHRRPDHKTHCVRGHEYAVVGTYWNGERNACRSCQSVACARSRARLHGRPTKIREGHIPGRGGARQEHALTLLAEGQTTRAILSARLGVSRGAADKVLHRLILKGLVERCAPGVYRRVGGA